MLHDSLRHALAVLIGVLIGSAYPLEAPPLSRFETESPSSLTGIADKSAGFQSATEPELAESEVAVPDAKNG